MMLSGSLAVVVSLLGLTVASPFEVLDKRQTEPGSARTVLTVQLDELRPRDSNQSYFGVNVSVGTPPQHLRLALNLERQSVTIVHQPYDEPPSDAAEGNYFVNSSSSTFAAPIDSTIAFMSFRDEEYTGDKWRDTVVIGDTTIPNATLEVAVQRITEEGNVMYPKDRGVLGLGLNQWGTQAPMQIPEQSDWIAAAGRGSISVINPWNASSFAIALDRDPRKKAGSITFGGVEQDKYEGRFRSTTTAHLGMWTLALDKIMLDSISIGYITTDRLGDDEQQDPIYMLMDPTSDTINLPPQTLLNLLRFIPESKNTSDGWRVPCDTGVQLNFTFNRVDYNMDSPTWINKDSNLDGMCTTYFAPSSYTEKPLREDLRVYAMGPLMRNFYTSYEYRSLSDTIGSQIRLARAVGGPVYTAAGGSSSPGSSSGNGISSSSSSASKAQVVLDAVFLGAVVGVAVVATAL